MSFNVYRYLLVNSSVAFIIGVIFLCIPKIPWFNDFLGDIYHWQEIMRDIGIAFLIAVVVSLIFELNTRTKAERHKMSGVLQTVMSSFVPESVWNEVNREILHRMVARCNLKIDLCLYQNGEIIDGKPLDLPNTHAVLNIKTSYDLYSLLTGSCEVDVIHFLDQHMKTGENDFPRFQSVKVRTDKNKVQEWTDESLTEVYDRQTGRLRLTGKHGVKLRSMNRKSPVTIEFERYEIVNTPGLYTLVMPEMVVPSPIGSDSSPTICVQINPQNLSNVDINVLTWFSSSDHEFKKISNFEWKFFGVMLPGQAFSIVLKPRLTASSSV